MKWKMDRRMLQVIAVLLVLMLGAGFQYYQRETMLWSDANASAMRELTQKGPRSMLDHYEAFYRRSVRVLWWDTPKQTASLDRLAECWMDLGEYGIADSLFARSRELQLRRYGRNGPGLGYLDGNVGRLRLRQGRPAAAESLFRSALEIHRRQFHSLDQRVADDLAWLANSHEELGHAVSAESLYWSAIGMSRHLRESGFAKPWREFDVQLLDHFAMVLFDRRRFAEAESLLLIARTGEALLDEKSPLAAARRAHHLGCAFLANHREAEAESLLTAALTTQLAVLPGDAPEIRETQSALEVLERRGGRSRGAGDTRRTH